MNLCARIRSARVRTGISQQELAKSIGVSRGAVANWESNAKAVPRVENLRGIAARLGVSLSWLVAGQEPDPDTAHKAHAHSNNASERIDPSPVYERWENEIARNMRTVLDMVPEPLILSVPAQDSLHSWDLRRRILYLNQALREALGCTLGQTTTVEALHERFFPEPAYRAEVSAHWSGLLQASIKQRKRTASARYLIHCGEGHYRWFDLRVYPDNTSLPGFRLCAFREARESGPVHRQVGMHVQSDPVTGLPNRWVGEREVERLLLAKQEQGSGLCVMLCDIDRFKQVNADFGRDGGNELLRSVANVIRHNLRDTDVLTRWDGGVFLLALPTPDEAQAARLVERLHKTVRAVNVELRGARMPVSASIGAVLVQHEVSVTELIAAVNAAVYAAKRRGHNRGHFMRGGKTVHAVAELSS